jgi:putative SbcD/Mre11-related phosphoesterase
MGVRFLTNEPAMLIGDREHGRILAIADLHLGIEHELFRDGITIAPQAKKLFEKISRLIRATRAEKLVIIGDLKHKVPGISFRELKEIPKFIEPLAEKVHIVLVRGNHDTEFKDMFRGNVEVHGAKGFAIGKYGFFHGHAWPHKEMLKCDHLLTAHIHPTVEFIDDFGFRLVEKVWVKGRLKEKIVKEKYKIGKRRKGKKAKEEKNFEFGGMQTIIFPSFNPVISGVPLNSKRKRNYIGPLLSSGAFDVRKAEAYMLDGTALGEVRKIK